MSLSSVIAEYQNLVNTWPQPNKKQVVELRKFLMTIKKECDLERKRLLGSKTPEPQPEPEPVVEVESIPEMLPLTREVTVNISSDQAVESVEVEVKKKKRKVQKTKKSL